MENFSRFEIAEVIAGEFDLIWSDIQPGDRLDSLTDGFDVMDRMRLCRKLGTAFKFDIPWEDQDEFETIQDVYECLKREFERQESERVTAQGKAVTG